MLATTHNVLLPSCHNLQGALVNHHLAKKREECISQVLLSIITGATLRCTSASLRDCFARDLWFAIALLVCLLEWICDLSFKIYPPSPHIVPSLNTHVSFISPKQWWAISSFSMFAHTHTTCPQPTIYTHTHRRIQTQKPPTTSSFLKSIKFGQEREREMYHSWSSPRVSIYAVQKSLSLHWWDQPPPPCQNWQELKSSRITMSREREVEIEGRERKKGRKKKLKLLFYFFYCLARKKDHQS